MVIECQPPVNPDIVNQPPFDPNAQTFDPNLPFALDPTQAVNGPYRTTPIPNITAPENLQAVFDLLENENENAFKTPNELFGAALDELETARDIRVTEIDNELVFVDELIAGSTPAKEEAYDDFYDDTYSDPYTQEHPDPGPDDINPSLAYPNRPGKTALPASININQRKNQLEFEREVLIGSTKDIQQTSDDNSFFVLEETSVIPDVGNLFLGNVQNGLETLRTDLYGPVPSTPSFNPGFYDSPRSIDDFGNFGIGNLLGEGNLILGHAGAQLRNLPNTLGLLNARSQYNVQTGVDDPCGIFGDLLNSLLGDLLSLLADLLNQLLAPLFALLALLASIINELLALLNMINQLLNLGFAQNLLNLNPCSLPFMSQLGSNQLLNAINLPSRPSAPNLGIPNIGNPF